MRLANRRQFLTTTATAVAGFGFNVSCASVLGGTGAGRKNALVPLRDATSWLNSPPLSAESLRGRTVLVNFCTYSCINWLRQLPYVRAWAEKYNPQGLVVVGVHTPEFGFERDIDKVRRAAASMQVNYPIAMDNQYAIWNAFENRYWPALYFIDAKGTIRHQQFGEGRYDQAEKMIQTLLAKAESVRISRDVVTVEASGIEADADWKNLGSPEMYLGSTRAEHFQSRRTSVHGAKRDYVVPSRLRLNEWSLGGDWTVRNEAILLNKPHGQIACRFHARDLHLVMGPANPGGIVRIRVSLDGSPPAGDRGSDVDDQGFGTVADHRLHQLIRQRGPIADRQFTIEILDADLEAFSFTFG